MDSETTAQRSSSSRAQTPWYTLSVAEVEQTLQTRISDGLSDAEVARRREQYGRNSLVESQGRPLYLILLDQFKSLIVALLIVATIIAFALGENIEAVAVLVVIVLNASVGFITEWKAEQALTALGKQTAPTAHVLRDGSEQQVAASELVPGDIVILAAGLRVPADGRIVESVQLQIGESALTGESHAVSKMCDPISDVKAPLSDRQNMAFLGTSVTDGRGRLVVTTTGMLTEVGRIGTMIEEAGTRSTPLERKLEHLGNSLIGVVLALCGVVVCVGWLRGNGFLYMLEVGVSLAIAAVPEGLPAVTTMTLAIGMQRMARMGALIRRLPAVETLGSTTVICTDKTGTLTKNEMTVRQLQLGTRQVEVTGVGYSLQGEFREGESVLKAESDPQLSLALRIGALCSDAKFDNSHDDSSLLGDPTEGALLVAAAKAGMMKEELDREFPRVDEIPFSSESKRMTTIHRLPDGKKVAYVKGGPGVITEDCVSILTEHGIQPMSEDVRSQVLEGSVNMAKRALRVLALACKDVPEGIENDEAKWNENLVFVGMVGMIDPLRNEAKVAIETCRQAGIRTIMITGDHEETAAEIGRQLGLNRDQKGQPLKTAHGRNLNNLETAGWQEIASRVGVFARVSPEHKLRIVEAMQANGDIVAMTGDGVNDAPALKQADIGIAMGIKGTEVAKEASAMVITDDNFATIVRAIEQGRVIYANILRFVHYLFSCNLAEILVVFVALLLGWPLPLGALQILWLNMLTDVFPALALALEPSAPDVMKQSPRDPQEPLVTRGFILLISWQGLLLTAATLVAFAVGMQWHGSEGQGLVRSTTMAFMTLAFSQIFHVFNARSQHDSAFTARLFTNSWLWGAIFFCVLLQIAAVNLPLLQVVLKTTSPSWSDWIVILGCSFLPVALVELVKFIQQSRATKRSNPNSIADSTNNSSIP